MVSNVLAFGLSYHSNSVLDVGFEKFITLDRKEDLNQEGRKITLTFLRVRLGKNSNPKGLDLKRSK